LVLVWRVVSLVIGFAGWILAGRSLNADQDDVEISIYRWAKLDDQSGPDRSIELNWEHSGRRCQRRSYDLCSQDRHPRGPWAARGAPANGGDI
jgi:hypothetical protein